jgi:hypothetical protein
VHLLDFNKRIVFNYLFQLHDISSSLHLPENGLGRFTLEILSLKGSILSDGSIITSILLVDCRLDDTRFKSDSMTLENDNKYRVFCRNKNISIEFLPCLSDWLSFSQRYMKIAVIIIVNKRDGFTVDKMWCVLEFLYTTYVGTFNVITRSYSFRTPMLRFYKKNKKQNITPSGIIRET